MPSNFTIVIPTGDRPKCVYDCVRAFSKQVDRAVELIVVDAGQKESVDDAGLAQLWEKSRVVRSEQRNAGVQRNMGVLAAKGDIIVFLDDDTIVQEGWWPGIIEPLIDDDHGLQTTDHRRQMPEAERKETTTKHQAPGTKNQAPSTKNRELSASTTQQPTTNNYSPSPIGAVAGAVWMNKSPKLTDKRGGYVNWRGEPIQVTHRSARAPRCVDWAMTTNMAVRKEAFLSVNGFASVYGVYDEDVDLGLKLRKKGWRIVYKHDAAVHHCSRDRGPIKDSCEREYLLGRNRGILLTRNYGMVAPRTAVFLLVAPFSSYFRTVYASPRRIFLSVLFAIAYTAGGIKGAFRGMRHPVRADSLG